jgi:serine/threonine protein kinase
VQAKHIFDELRLELISTIAEGGMGVVYEALQHGTGDFRKVVALKLIREEYSAIEEFKANFMGGGVHCLTHLPRTLLRPQEMRKGWTTPGDRPSRCGSTQYHDRP